jgi:ABC-type glycerol-3-phosphate transport system substrate-binding protein
MRTIMSITKFMIFVAVVSISLAACAKPNLISTETPGSNGMIPTQTTPDPAQVQTLTPEVIIPTATATRSAYMQIDKESLIGITLDFVHPWSGETANAIQALVNEFNKVNEWGITVKVQSSGGNETLYDQLQENLRSDTMPDVIAINPYLARRLEGDHYWLDVTEYLHDEQWGIAQDQINDIPYTFFDLSKVGSRILGMPIGMSASALYYNQTWAKELGFSSPPTTPAELQQQVCAAAQTKMIDNDISNNGTGGMWINNSPNSVISWYAAFGGSIPDGSEITQFNDQAAVDSFTFIKELFDQSCAWVGRQPTPYDYFANRFTLVYPGNLEDIDLQSNAFLSSGSLDEWILIPYPTLDGKGTYLVDGSTLLISVAKPETQLASWLFVRWLSSSPAQQVFSNTSLYWPLQLSSVTRMDDLLADRPQFDDLLHDLDLAQAAPTYPAWAMDRMVLQDAFWQYLTGYQQNLPDVLTLLDATIAELSESDDGN